MNGILEHSDHTVEDHVSHANGMRRS